MRVLASLRAVSAAVALCLSGQSAAALTVALDFGPSYDINGYAMTSYDGSAYGFSGLDQASSQQAVLAAVQAHYLGYPTLLTDLSSPIPEGYQLDIDFVLGSYGALPSNGDTDYYVFGIGEGVGAAGQDALGRAYYQGIRGPDYAPFSVGALVGSIYTDSIATLAGLASNDAQLINLIAGTTSHEIGHALGLIHPNGPQSNPGQSSYGLMATGGAPSNMPNAQRVLVREFSYSNAGILVENVGLREAPPSVISAVPAPPAGALLGAALITLMAGRRTRAKPA